MALPLASLGIVVGGYAAGLSLWPADDDALSPMERVLVSAILSLALGVALSSALATVHFLYASALIAGAVVAGGAGAAYLFRAAPWRSWRNVEIPRWEALVAVPCLAALAVWVAFTLWRSSIVFVMSHDGLSYHMPRAVMLMRDHGYRFIDAADIRLAWPCNYELLLADTMLLSGSDRSSGLVAIGASVLLLVAVAAVTERWWQTRLTTLTVVLAVAASPIVLVTFDAHKNDTLCAALFVAAAHFGARWCVRPRVASFVLACLTVGLAAGTKLHVLALAGGLAPLLAWGVWGALRAPAARKRRALSQAALGGSFLVLCVALLGGQVYLVNVVASGHATGWVDAGRIVPARLFSPTGPRDFFYVMMAAPFSSRWPGAVWIPWQKAFWFAPTYDLFFSNFGPLFPLMLGAGAVALLVLGVRRVTAGRRSAFALDGLAMERLATTIALLGAYAFILFVPPRIPAMTYATPRYVLGLMPLCAAWVLGPLCRLLATGGPAGRVARMALAPGMALYFCVQAVQAAEQDGYEPLAFVLDAEDHPAIRRKIFNFPGRAASVVDAMAGPDDTIAIDGEYDSWLYPAYGAELRRPVLLLHPGKDGVAIPDEARWVVVDRAWGSWFGNPGFTDMGKWWELIGRGRATDDELRVFRQLRHDPRFALRFRDRHFNQAVFERVDDERHRGSATQE